MKHERDRFYVRGIDVYLMLHACDLGKLSHEGPTLAVVIYCLKCCLHNNRKI